jgi:hypothetical protein
MAAHMGYTIVVFADGFRQSGLAMHPEPKQHRGYSAARNFGGHFRSTARFSGWSWTSLRDVGGEGAWESNPPARLVTPHDGFEDRTGHRARSAPRFVSIAAWHRTPGAMHCDG